MIVDGVSSTETVVPWNLGLAIGSYENWPGLHRAANGLQGSLDDVSVFNDVLTPAKAKAIYNLGSSPGEYDLRNCQALFNTFDQPTHPSAVTSDGNLELCHRTVWGSGCASRQYHHRAGRQRQRAPG